MGGCETVMEPDLIASHWPLDLQAAFTEPPKPIDFVLPGLAVGCVGALVSPGGAGKSMLALQLAMQSWNRELCSTCLPRTLCQCYITGYLPWVRTLMQGSVRRLNTTLG